MFRLLLSFGYKLSRSCWTIGPGSKCPENRKRLTDYHNLVAVGLVLALTIIAFETWVIYLLARQHGRTLLVQDGFGERLAAAESTIARMQGQQLSAQAAPNPKPGLRVGEAAPDFKLADLHGGMRSLADFRGASVVIIFFNPECGFCQQLAPRLGRIAGDAPRVIVMSRGEPEVHHRLVREHRWQVDVLLEPGWEVATRYRTNATPTGYLIDAEGRIASSLAAGMDDVLNLMNLQAPDHHDARQPSPAEKQQVAEEKLRASGLQARPLSESHLQRNGLRAGTPAPDFTLKDLNGVEHSLSSLRGRRVLLLFSDPGCGPCQTLAPMLEQRHRRRADPGLQMLMVTRGDLSINREKAREHDLTFPVLIQNSWEISRKYAMFATPIGYLIDEEGTIAADVAVGAEAILQLETLLEDRKPAFAGVNPKPAPRLIEMRGTP